jgi:hypothetical protein
MSIITSGNSWEAAAVALVLADVAGAAAAIATVVVVAVVVGVAVASVSAVAAVVLLLLFLLLLLLLLLLSEPQDIYLYRCAGQIVIQIWILNLVLGSPGWLLGGRLGAGNTPQDYSFYLTQYQPDRLHLTPIREGFWLGWP